MSAEESRFYRLVRPLVPAPLRPLVLRWQEQLSYLAVGGVTTAVNFAVYFPLSRLVHYLVALTVAWGAAVAFAFFANKILVFEDPRWDRPYVLRQAGRFAAMRALSWGMEAAIMWLCVERAGCSADLTKVAAQFLVIVSNYLFSKLLIFRRREGS